MSQYEEIVASVQQRLDARKEIAEAGFITSLILAPFKVLFWGVTFLLKLIGIILVVVGVTAAGSVALLGAFIWFLTNFARGKFRSFKDAEHADPKRAGDAKRYAAEIADQLRDPRIQSELRSDPRAASVLHDALSECGYQQQVASSCIAIACADLPDDGIVTADWQEFFESPIFVGLAFTLSVLLGGWGMALTSLLWFMAGIATHKWATHDEAKRHDPAKTNAAVKSAAKVKKALNHPKLQAVFAKSPKAKELLEKSLAALETKAITARVALESLDIKEVSETLNIPASKIKIVGTIVNIKGDVDLSNKGLTKIPYHFGTVTGYFDCSYNNLTSLEGCPLKVGGSFYCDTNNLTSLEGCPKEVGGGFRCDNNNLTSLEGCPKKVGGNFYCSDNKLTSLEGAPKEVGGDFWCSGNNLASLEGAPLKVGGGFNCSYNKLTSLEGGPKEVGGSFMCSGNNLASLEGCPLKVGGSFYCDTNNLTSLEGCPLKVGGSFYCDTNNLTSLEGCPKEVKGSFYCSGNPGSKNFKKPLGVKGTFHK